MKAFFKKVLDYIKNTAWIQPLLIVVVIFVILFSLSPLTAGIKKLWTNISTINSMKTVSYSEYCEMVTNAKEDEKFIIVFTDSNDDNSAVFYKSMNNYLKSDDYKQNKGNFKIYNVNITTRSTTKKIVDRAGNKIKCTKYKDRTIGVVSPSNKQNDSNFTSQDAIYSLDRRLEQMVRDLDGEGYNELDTASYSESYDYISGQLVIWYEGGVETRVSNNYLSTLSIDSTGKKVSASSFKAYIEEFDGETTYGNVSDTWRTEFDLKPVK